MLVRCRHRPSQNVVLINHFDVLSYCKCLWDHFETKFNTLGQTVLEIQPQMYGALARHRSGTRDGDAPPVRRRRWPKRSERLSADRDADLCGILLLII